VTNFVSDWHMIETFHNLLCYKKQNHLSRVVVSRIVCRWENVLKYAGINIILLFINIIIIFIYLF
jgi:hypothetical protein